MAADEKTACKISRKEVRYKGMAVPAFAAKNGTDKVSNDKKEPLANEFLF